jgi:hypothetical protein
MDELELHAFKFMNGEFDKEITAKEALRRIHFLKYSFYGDKRSLHEEIDKIISKVK